MKIFSGSANHPLAEKIAEALGHEVSPRELFVFPDGERRVQIQENVVEEDTIIVQPTSTPVDQNYMELFFLSDGLRRSGARSVTAVIPYFGYQRQDHVFRDGEAVSLEVIIKFLKTVDIDCVIAFDLHSIKIPELFSMSVSHLSALPLFAEKIKQNGWNKDNTFLVSPDMGGLRRIDKMSDLLEGMPSIATVKDRDLNTGQIVINNIEGDINNIKNRALLVDDMISSGSTIVKSAELLKHKGVEEVIAFATHAVFSTDAPKFLQESVIDEVYVTDTVLIPEEKKFPKLKVLSIAEMIALDIRDKLQ